MADTIRVIYVDDEPALLEMGKQFLEHEGEFSVEGVVSASEALDILSKNTYDAIVSDYLMPEMNGIGFLKRVRAVDKNIPFIMFTGRSREEIVIEALNNGANFYLQKGGNPKPLYKELAHTIRQSIIMRKALATVAEQEQRYHDLQNANDLIQSVAPDGHFLFVNKKWLDTLEYEEHELKNLTIFDIIDKESLRHCMETFQKVMSGENVGIIEAAFKTRNGIKVYVEGMATCKMAEGQPQYTRGLFKDITERKNAEAALKESEERYRNVVEDQTEFISRFRPDGTFVFVNDAFCRYFNTTREEILGKRYIPNIPETDMAGITGHLATLTPEHPLATASNRIMLKDGQVRWQQWSNRAIFDNEGNVLEYQSVGRDITDLKDAEQELIRKNEEINAALEELTASQDEIQHNYNLISRKEQEISESELKFRTIFENTPYPICINNLPEGKFIAVNAAFLKSSGYSKSEILGKNPVELGMLTRMDFVRLVSHFALAGKIENVPMAFTGKGGKKVHVQFSTIPITINERPAIMTVTAEITQLKRVEEELLQKNEELQVSEENFRKIFENSPLGMTLVLPDLRFLIVNPAWVSMMGYTEEEFRKMSFKDITHPDNMASDMKNISALEAGSIPVYCTEKQYIRKDGSILWGALKVTTVRNYDGTLRNYLAQIEDITLRKQAEELVRESENKFATIFQNSPVALTLVSATDGIFVDVNDAFVKNTGYSRNEVIGITSEALGIFADINQRNLLASTLHNRQVVHDMEISCRIKTGEIRSCLFSSSILIIRGRPHIFSTITDVTEQKNTDAAFRAMVKSMVGTTGVDSLRQITESVSSWLGAECVMVGEIQPDRQTVSVVSMLLDGKNITDFSYTLKGTPCENVTEKGFCQYSDNVRQLFPESRDLAELNIRGYIGTPLRNSRGQVIGILCAMFRNPVKTTHSDQEIMNIIAVKAAAEIERRRDEEALRESEEWFRAIFENANDAITVLGFTPEGYPSRFTNVNDNICRISGYTREELLTLSPQDLDDPNELAESRELTRKLIEQGHLLFERTLVRKDGKKIPIEISTHIFTISNRKVLLSIIRDISERRRDEEALRESEEHYRSLAEQVHDGIYIYKGNHFVFVNTLISRITGYSKDELLTMDFFNLVHPDDRAYVQDLAEKRQRGQHVPDVYEIRIVQKDGGVRYAELAVSIIGFKGEPAVLGAARDITERIRSERALQQANKKLNLLSSITRHDIKNQLLSLNGFVGLLHEKIPDSPYENYFTRIAEASGHITDMIRFTKEYEKVGVHASVWQDLQSLVNTTGEGITQGQVTLKNDIPPDFKVYADPLIIKVFFNLVDNAIRHGGTISTIKFSIEEHNDDRIIVCKDDGCGVADKDKEIIFKHGVGKNTGFGLAFSREILDITGITIKETGKPKEGARFEITVPKGQYKSISQ